MRMSEGRVLQTERTWVGSVLVGSQNRKALWLDLQEQGTEWSGREGPDYQGPIRPCPLVFNLCEMRDQLEVFCG